MLMLSGGGVWSRTSGTNVCGYKLSCGFPIRSVVTSKQAKLVFRFTATQLL
jgi:hypothetical protein